MTFQRVVNNQPAPGVAGDFASVNPRANILAVPNGLVADTPGVIVGNFGFANPDTGLVSKIYAAGNRFGFVERSNNALITVFLADSTMVILVGLPAILFDAGEFWAKFAAGATRGQKVFANVNDGSVLAAAAGAAVAAVGGATSAGTSTAAAGVLTVVTLATGTFAIGQIVTGGTLAANTRIVSQLTGTPGGAGTYQLSDAGAATAAATVTAVANVETNYWVDRTVSAGEISQISSWG